MHAPKDEHLPGGRSARRTQPMCYCGESGVIQGGVNSELIRILVRARENVLHSRCARSQVLLVLRQRHELLHGHAGQSRVGCLRYRR
eukprot:5927723-Pleurochrysis_carterae.AAC.1